VRGDGRQRRGLGARKCKGGINFEMESAAARSVGARILADVEETNLEEVSE
jgi:hypothetical protein